MSACLTWCVRGIATRFGLAFSPQSARHIHTRPIPRLGGIAIVTTFVVVFSLYLFSARHGLGQPPAIDKFYKLMLPALALFVTGLVDDVKGLSARAKLLVEVGGGACLYFGGLGFTCFTWPAAGALVSAALCLMATVAWVVLVCNAMNLIDGLDGLAAGAALFSMVTIFTLALIGGRPGVAMATAVLGGSLFGFLIYNFNPASIFLGDSGSLFLGFMLSGFVMTESHSQKTMVASVLVPLVAFALPLTDVALSMLRRFLSGHSLFGADREHIHHKLLELGLTQRQAVMILYGFSAACAVLSLSLLYTTRLLLIPVIGILVLLLFFLLRRLGYHEFAEVQRIGQRVAWQKELLARNITVRKVAARLQKTRSLTRTVELLETCLRKDFDGFKVVLDPEFMQGMLQESARPVFAQKFWDQTQHERVVFTLNLTTPSFGTVGTLSLHRSVEAELPIDADLFTRELRRSFGMALENCAQQPKPQLKLVQEGQMAVGE
ncbi:MAG: undecaprenyl/decaprenyl-phosphate alpha-N-acetylglucosaminyl 1-phosphate transferase [Acidobacteriia bacterium]|nr:undecaprenyl/decaprenyl-phosphate alpha-N-acetylglucosaminyl 1-phosphate transferase [Terriglobia bacterium]